jgi:hypothetical protein
MNGIGKLCAATILVAQITLVSSAQDPTVDPVFHFQLKVTTPLEYDNVPMDPLIDFGERIRKAGGEGFIDLNSIEVINLATGLHQPHALSRFESATSLHVEWVIANREQVDYEIRFRTTPVRIAAHPQQYTPAIGVGDLLRYNAGRPRPITMFYGMSLVDLDGDGRRDLAGCWNYSYRADDPRSGIVYYPRVTDGGDAQPADALDANRSFQFGDLTRLRYRETLDAVELKHFVHTYTSADFTDMNGDGRVDFVVTANGTKTATIFLNSSQADTARQPTFRRSTAIPVGGWKACRAVDLNQDGATDLVVDGKLVRNSNPQGWPFEPEAPITLDAGREPCFVDVDGDGHLDAVCLQGGSTTQPDGYRIAWRKNLGGDPPRFDEEHPLAGIEPQWCSYVSAVRDESRPALLVQHNVFQDISKYEMVIPPPDGSASDATSVVSPRFSKVARAASISAVLSLSDQAWPCLRDWDDDGDLDLLVGGGYGWPRIVINTGTKARPSYAEPRRILADGKPIRFLRDEILGPPNHWHNMGYPYPEFVDWDGDGLCDLVCANETNRILWFHNVGSQDDPRFGVRQQIAVDDFPDSPQNKQKSAQLAQKDTYPREPNRPFFWRTAPAFADWNDDGLMDLITLSGDTRQATLFTQHKKPDGRLALKRAPALRLIDGRPIDDRIVSRRSHWTEAFRPCDWDNDGRIDLMYSLAGSHGGIQDGGSIYLLRNVGTKKEPIFGQPVTMRCFGEPIQITAHGPCARPCDYDGDGKIDLVACVEWSVYPFYRHAALMMKARPEFEILEP